MGFGTISLLGLGKKMILKLSSINQCQSYTFRSEDITGFWLRDKKINVYLKGGQTIEIYNFIVKDDDEWENFDEFLENLKKCFNTDSV